MEPKEHDRDDNTKYLVQCEHCKGWMLIVEGARRVCRDCVNKLNQVTTLKAEEEKRKAEERSWAAEERRLWQNREVG